MASLKEVKNRISSVQVTRKITQARQMVSAAQLHRTQGMLEKAKNYRDALEVLLTRLSEQISLSATPLSEQREKGAMAVIIMTSNSGMCGSFNARMAREVDNVKKLYPGEELLFYPIGKKIKETLLKTDCQIVKADFNRLSDKASYHDTTALLEELISLFLSRKFKRVEMIYYHFKSMNTQQIKHSQLLPFTTNTEGRVGPTDDIIEPSTQDLLQALLPMLIKSRFYSNLLNNRASEHAARTIAMQLATENANDMLSELQLAYNKLRQQNITAELLDIIGGSFA